MKWRASPKRPPKRTRGQRRQRGALLVALIGVLLLAVSGVLLVEGSGLFPQQQRRAGAHRHGVDTTTATAKPKPTAEANQAEANRQANAATRQVSAAKTGHGGRRATTTRTAVAGRAIRSISGRWCAEHQRAGRTDQYRSAVALGVSRSQIDLRYASDDRHAATADTDGQIQYPVARDECNFYLAMA